MFQQLPIRRVALSLAMFACLAQTSRADDEPTPIATAKHPTGLIVEVLEVKMDDTQEKVKITWRYRNPTKKAIVLVAPSDPKIAVLGKHHYEKYWDDAYYTVGKIDSEKSYRAGVIRTLKKPITFEATDITLSGITIPAEGQYEVWAKFARPENKDDKIHLHVPEVELFENLKIAPEKK